MSKVLCIKDLNFNYDYATVLQKGYLTEEMEDLPLSSLKNCLKQVENTEVKSVLLLGKLFDEMTLMVDEIDRFTNLMASFESLEFIIAPNERLTEESWYALINWPKNCHVVSNLVNYYENSSAGVIFYENELNDSLMQKKDIKVAVVNQWNEKISEFLPKAFSNEKLDSICIYDTETGSCTYQKNQDLNLLEVHCRVDQSMSIDEIVTSVLALKINEEGKVFYKCILEGTISKALNGDLVSVLKEKTAEDMDCIFINNTYKFQDIDQIKNENKENLIGIFIENVQESDINGDEERRVIETGLNYLI